MYLLASSESGDNDSHYLKVTLSVKRDNGASTVSGTSQVLNKCYLLLDDLGKLPNLSALNLTSLTNGGSTSTPPKQQQQQHKVVRIIRVNVCIIPRMMQAQSKPL